MACLDGVAHHCGVCDRSVDDADGLERELDSLRSQLATEREANKSLRSELKLSMDGERGLMAAVLGTIGGKVEGAPTLPINYLQRLRELTLKEALLAISKTQLATEREAHARTLAALSSAADMLEVVSCTELFRRYPQDFQARLRASFISFRAAAKVTP